MGMTIEYLTGSTGSFYPLGYEPGIYYANSPCQAISVSSLRRLLACRTANVQPDYLNDTGTARPSRFFVFSDVQTVPGGRARRAWIHRRHVLVGRSQRPWHASWSGSH